MNCIGVAFLGIGSVMSIVSVLSIFRLSHKIGPIHLAIYRCLKILLSFLVTFLIITLAFSVGLYYVVNESAEDNDHEATFHTSNIFVAIGEQIEASWKITCLNESHPINCTLSCIRSLFNNSLSRWVFFNTVNNVNTSGCLIHFFSFINLNNDYFEDFKRPLWLPDL